MSSTNMRSPLKMAVPFRHILLASFGPKLPFLRRLYMMISGGGPERSKETPLLAKNES